MARVPAGFAGRAEFHVAGFALHQLGGLYPYVLELAHGLASGCWAPRPARVKEHLWHKETEDENQMQDTMGTGEGA